MVGVDGLRLAVADEENLGRTRRRCVPVLAEGLGLAFGLGHGAQEYGARGDGGFADRRRRSRSLRRRPEVVEVVP
jgi:hypothetical protein